MKDKVPQIRAHAPSNVSLPPLLALPLGSLIAACFRQQGLTEAIRELPGQPVRPAEFGR
jgi:hypothetical protein